MEKLKKDLNLKTFEKNSENFVRVSLSPDRDVAFSMPINNTLPEHFCYDVDGYYNHQLALGGNSNSSISIFTISECD
jgi:hypothetical protein